MKPKLILASASQRRAEILAASGVKFDVKVSNAEEISDETICVKELVLENSKIKALKIADTNKECIVIGADTLVSVNNIVMGKPELNQTADEMFEKYCDNDAYVYTGLTLIYKDKTVCGTEESIVKINKDVYSENKELIKKIFSYDKAGGFSIEGLGAIVFDDICGSYFNILGFPMKLFYNLLKQLGFNILDFG